MRESPMREWHLSDFQTIGSPLGGGAYGQVSKVKHKVTGEIYAMKIIPKSKVVEHKMVDYLAREVKTQFRLKHPNILTLHYYFEDPDSVQLLLEYASGGSLFSVLRKRGRLPEPEAAKYFVEVAQALDHLHSKGVIHRDLKPENILMCEDNVAKLADFGWCAELSSDGKPRQTFCGTWDYLSPEMVENEPHDRTVDVWAIGVLLYEMLTARSPFSASSQMKALIRITSVDLKYPDYVTTLARDLIGQLLVKEKSERLPLSLAVRHTWVREHLYGKNVSPLEGGLSLATPGLKGDDMLPLPPQQPPKAEPGEGNFARSERSRRARTEDEATVTRAARAAHANAAVLSKQSRAKSSGARARSKESTSSGQSSRAVSKDCSAGEGPDTDAAAPDAGYGTNGREVRKGIIETDGTTCICGNTFLSDENFCRRCGAPRESSFEGSPPAKLCGTGASNLSTPPGKVCIDTCSTSPSGDVLPHSWSSQTSTNATNGRPPLPSPSPSPAGSKPPVCHQGQQQPPGPEAVDRKHFRPLPAALDGKVMEGVLGGDVSPASHADLPKEMLFLLSTLRSPKAFTQSDRIDVPAVDVPLENSSSEVASPSSDVSSLPPALANFLGALHANRDELPRSPGCRPGAPPSPLADSGPSPASREPSVPPAAAADLDAERRDRDRRKRQERQKKLEEEREALEREERALLQHQRQLREERKRDSKSRPDVAAVEMANSTTSIGDLAGDALSCSGRSMDDQPPNLSQAMIAGCTELDMTRPIDPVAVPSCVSVRTQPQRYSEGEVSSAQQARQSIATTVRTQPQLSITTYMTGGDAPEGKSPISGRRGDVSPMAQLNCAEPDFAATLPASDRSAGVLCDAPKEVNAEADDPFTRALSSLNPFY